MALDARAVSEELKTRGYAVLDRFLDSRTLRAVDVEFSRAAELLPSYDYPFGDQYRAEAMALRASIGQSLPATAELLLEGPLASVCSIYGATEERDLIVWSYEFNRDTEAIYGIPHFDRRHQLKVFVYLTDVDEQDGPTHVAVEEPGHFQGRWLAAWRDALSLKGSSDAEVLEQVRTTPEDASAYRSVACEVELPRDRFKPLTGGAGTVVIFDTSLAHFGGLITASSGARRTVRRHCLLD